jgi:dinuclear metal center YbgI/SA1388 family protein
MTVRAARVQDLLGALHGLYPPDLAEDWDNVGLQVGDPAAVVTRVLVALDPSAAALTAAQRQGAQLLVTHHPLLFKPLRRLTPDDPVGKVVWQAVQSGVAIISAHTNLDVAPAGLNCWLAQRLGLQGSEPLQTAVGQLVKLVVYVPTGHEEPVAEALFAAGAGQIGAYDHCSFRTAGIGTFRPGPGSTPFIGVAGIRETVEELRLETIVPRRRLGKVVDKLLKAHPYEEVAYDLIPLANPLPDTGLGRIGRLAEPLTLAALGAKVKAALVCTTIRLVGDLDRPVSKLAICGGSGAGLIQEAKRRGAEALVTGDIKYHEARLAEELGLALVDAGHFATEVPAVAGLAEALTRQAAANRWPLEVMAYQDECDPFVVR